jgi:N,N'-diacetylchitobiose transport system permease protein
MTDTTPTVMAGTRTNRYRTMTWVWRAVAIVFAAVIIFPVYWMVNSAFEPNSAITSLTPSFFPVHFTLHNFASAVNQTSGSGKAYFWDDARNSLIVVTSAVVLTLIVGFLAAAAISRFRLRGAAVFLVLILVVQMVPGTALIIPTFLLLNNLHLTDHYFGLILVYAATTLPFTIWVLRGFVRGVPIELEEAGQVDGLSRMGAFVRILLPLLLPGLIATGIFAFITAWNDFLVADVIMQQNDHQTLPVWLFSFTTNTGTNYAGLMAGCTMMALPVVIFFLFVQRRIVSGFTAGSVKG